MSTVRPSELKFRSFGATFGAAGAHTIVAAVSGYRLKIVNALMTSSARISLTVQDTNGSDLIGAMPIDEYGGFVAPPAEGGWNISAVGTGIQLKVDAACVVGGVMVYQEVP